MLKELNFYLEVARLANFPIDTRVGGRVGVDREVDPKEQKCSALTL